MNGYSIIFCDMDGTLLDSRHRLDPDLAARIRELADKGTPFVPVSARMPDAMTPYLDEIGIHSPMVCYSGALVLDRNGNPVHSIGIPFEIAARIRNFVNGNWPETALSVYSFNQWIVADRTHPLVQREVDITGVEPVEGEMEELLGDECDVHKMFCVGPEKDIQQIEAALKRDFPMLFVCQSSPIYLEIMNGAATKANGVTFLCQAMRLSTNEAVAFGDNYNDIDMLEAVGLGVAMGNAPDDVKKIADRVTADHDHGGVLEMLNTLPFVSMKNSVRFERAKRF